MDLVLASLIQLKIHFDVILSEQQFGITFVSLGEVVIGA